MILKVSFYNLVNRFCQKNKTCSRCTIKRLNLSKTVLGWFFFLTWIHSSVKETDKSWYSAGWILRLRLILLRQVWTCLNLPMTPKNTHLFTLAHLSAGHSHWFMLLVHLIIIVTSHDVAGMQEKKNSSNHTTPHFKAGGGAPNCQKYYSAS